MAQKKTNTIADGIEFIGHNIPKDEENLAMTIEINREVYFEIKYLIGFAAEKHEYLSHIEDAIHIIDKLQECWKCAHDLYKQALIELDYESNETEE